MGAGRAKARENRGRARSATAVARRQPPLDALAWFEETVTVPYLAARDRGDATPDQPAMGKLFATESAQRVIDRAVQTLGGRGVVVGEVPERLYREIRALRIYEGTSEIQKLIIARAML